MRFVTTMKQHLYRGINHFKDLNQAQAHHIIQGYNITILHELPNIEQHELSSDFEAESGRRRNKVVKQLYLPNARRSSYDNNDLVFDDPILGRNEAPNKRVNERDEYCEGKEEHTCNECPPSNNLMHPCLGLQPGPHGRSPKMSLTTVSVMEQKLGLPGMDRKSRIDWGSQGLLYYWQSGL